MPANTENMREPCGYLIITGIQDKGNSTCKGPEVEHARILQETVRWASERGRERHGEVRAVGTRLRFLCGVRWYGVGEQHEGVGDSTLVALVSPSLLIWPPVFTGENTDSGESVFSESQLICVP